MSKLILKLDDLSHGLAKRYSGRLVVPKDAPRQLIKDIIKKATQEAIAADVYKNEQSRKLWKGKKAQVVWLSLFDNESDGESYCETFWVDKRLAKDRRPLPLIGNDSADDIIIKWKD